MENETIDLLLKAALLFYCIWWLTALPTVIKQTKEDIENSNKFK